MIDRFRFWMIQNHLLMTSRDNERKFQFVKHVIQADSLKYYRINDAYIMISHEKTCFIRGVLV